MRNLEGERLGNKEELNTEPGRTEKQLEKKQATSMHRVSRKEEVVMVSHVAEMPKKMKTKKLHGIRLRGS